MCEQGFSRVGRGPDGQPGAPRANSHRLTESGLGATIATKTPPHHLFFEGFQF